MKYFITPDNIIYQVVDEKCFLKYNPKAQDITLLPNVYDAFCKQEKFAQMNKYCSHCGLFTWSCDCGGHCYDEEEHKAWHHKYGEGEFKPIIENKIQTHLKPQWRHIIDKNTGKTHHFVLTEFLFCDKCKKIREILYCPQTPDTMEHWECGECGFADFDEVIE